MPKIIRQIVFHARHIEFRQIVFRQIVPHPKSAIRFSCHATLNSLIKQMLGFLDLPSVLEPRGLYRTDGKRLDGVTMIPWEMGKKLV